MEKIEPMILEHSLTKLIQDKSTAIREYALRRIDNLKSFGTMDAVKQQLNVEDSPEIKKIAAEAVEHLTEADGISLSEEILLKMVRSTNSEDRVYAARLMSKVTDERLFPYLSELIRDINHQVRIAALVSAGKVKSPEFWPALIANLSSPTYSNASAASIVTIGEPILPALEAAFNKTGQIPQTMVRIVQIYGRIQGKDAEELLWKKIDTTDKNVFSQALVSLSDIGYRAQEFQAARIKLTIETDIEDVAWNLEALDAIEEADKEEQEKSEENEESIVRNNYIRQALLEENHYNFDHIFMLLSMNYDPESIRLVKENAESGLTDNITFAIELLDVFMTEDLKPKLFPIIDDITQSERTKRLDEYFPPQNFENLEDLYLRIINRDYNRIDRWTKAVAIYNLGHLDGAVPGPALVANLFNQDPLIRQTAAWAIHELDKMTYQTNTRRLAPSVKKELDRVILPPTLITQDQHRPMLQVERIMLLSEIEIFSHIPRIVLAELSDYVEEVRYKEGTTIISQGDSGDTPMYIVVSGKINVFDQNKLVGELGKKEMIGETHVLDSDTNTASFITAEETAVFRLDKDKFYELICKNQEMVDGLITIMHKKFEEEPGPVVG